MNLWRPTLPAKSGSNKAHNLLGLAILNMLGKHCKGIKVGGNTIFQTQFFIY